MGSKIIAAGILTSMWLASWGAAATKQTGALELPAISPCTRIAHPALPVRWHGVYLMAPFTKAQLVLGDFLFDGAVPAVKIGLYGIRSGAIELLINNNQTYLLAEDGISLGDCVDLGDTGLRPPARDWLAFDARCDGHGPIGGRAADWWKMSPGSGAAAWMWFDTATAAPFRLMFVQPSQEPTILGGYALSYRVRFEDLSAASPGVLATSCEGKNRRAPETGPVALRKLLSAMERSHFKANSEVARLMPELSACTDGPVPRWLERATMTAVMTTPNVGESPLPAEILYDWPRQAQLTKMFTEPRTPLLSKEALLVAGHGYQISRISDKRPLCIAGMPGAVRPDWVQTSGCSCEAAIQGMTPLTPYGPVRIMRCPMGSLRVVWSWFAAGDRPQVFMQTSAPDDDGAGFLALVDYVSWMPGTAPSQASLKTPAQCPAAGSAPASDEMDLRPMGCGACHLSDSRLLH